jgi:hypothetical protein
MDAASAGMVAIIPLTVAPDTGASGSPAAFGALVLERFDNTSADAAFRQRAQWVARHGGLALRHALEHQSVPLLNWLPRRTWPTRGRRLPKLLLGLAALAAIASLARGRVDR